MRTHSPSEKGRGYVAPAQRSGTDCLDSFIKASRTIPLASMVGRARLLVAATTRFLPVCFAEPESVQRVVAIRPQACIGKARELVASFPMVW